MIDKTEIARTLRLLHGGDLVEIRALRGRQVWSGYFDDYGLAAETVARLDATEQPDGIYCTLQRIHEGLICRSPNKITANPERTTTDNDVTGIMWTLIDLDPVRPAGISASVRELAMAEAIAIRMRECMWPCNKERHIYACSGNGYHILLPQNEGIPSKTMLAGLQQAYGDNQVKIDQSTSKPSQIVKLYGTYSRKGFEVGDRRHRKSFIISP